MKSNFSNQIRLNPEGEIIQPLKLDGDQQMALDVFLLEELITKSNFSMAARFYQWNGAWLSLGSNQKNIPKRWIELAKINKLKIVKRPSGGGAVLHSGGLTYSLFWQCPPKKKKEAYLKVNEWLIESFSSMDLPLRFGNNPADRIFKNCFSTATISDLIDENGFKRIGSAQYWKKGSLLQHGEIILSPPESLWIDIFKTDPPKKQSLDFDVSQLEKSLINSLKKYWPKTNWKERSLNQEEISQVLLKSKDYSFEINY